MLKAASLAALIVCVGASPLFAQDADAAKNSEAMSSMLKLMGFSQDRDIRPGACRINVTANQEGVLASVPILQKMDILNNEMSKTELSKQPIKTTMAVAVQISSIVIKDLYDTNSSVENCSFVYSLLSNDDYGNEQKSLMFSYAFDRATYKKINWDKFQSQNIFKVAKNFKFGPEISARMSSE